MIPPVNTVVKHGLAFSKPLRTGQGSESMCNDIIGLSGIVRPTVVWLHPWSKRDIQWFRIYTEVIIKFVWVGGLIHLFRRHILNLQGNSPLVVFIKFRPAGAEILQHTDAEQRRYEKPKFPESLSFDDIAKSHIGACHYCSKIILKHNFRKR